MWVSAEISLSREAYAESMNNCLFCIFTREKFEISPGLSTCLIYEKC